MVSAAVGVGLCALLAATGSASTPSPSALRITKLSGSVVKYYGSSVVGVRLRATVCLGSPRETLAFYPDGIGVAHYAVSKQRKQWWLARSVVDHAPWLVPFGETWHGKACGPVVVEDPIPPDHYGAESLGNPLTCYGVRLTLRVGAKRASRRAIISCGGL